MTTGSHVTNASNCPLCLAGQPGRHPDRGGTHLYQEPRAKRPVIARHPTHWIADRDGVAHARSHLRGPRTACGIPAIDERYAWPPVRGRCGVCLAVLERVAFDAAGEVATA